MTHSPSGGRASFASPKGANGSRKTGPSSAMTPITPSTRSFRTASSSFRSQVPAPSSFAKRPRHRGGRVLLCLARGVARRRDPATRGRPLLLGVPFDRNPAGRPQVSAGRLPLFRRLPSCSTTLRPEPWTCRILLEPPPCTRVSTRRRRGRLSVRRRIPQRPAARRVRHQRRTGSDCHGGSGRAQGLCGPAATPDLGRHPLPQCGCDHRGLPGERRCSDLRRLRSRRRGRGIARRDARARRAVQDGVSRPQDRLGTRPRRLTTR